MVFQEDTFCSICGNEISEQKDISAKKSDRESGRKISKLERQMIDNRRATDVVVWRF